MRNGSSALLTSTRRLDDGRMQSILIRDYEVKCSDATGMFEGCAQVGNRDTLPSLIGGGDSGVELSCLRRSSETSAAQRGGRRLAASARHKIRSRAESRSDFSCVLPIP